jgi:Leucine-rich repeat (LRR) protein
MSSLLQNSPLLFCVSLDASYNPLSGEINFSAFQMPNLKNLSLSSCTINNISGTEAISSVVSLTLNNNNMKTLPASLANLQNLYSLNVN